MKKSSVILQFVGVFSATALAFVILLEFGLVERVSYQITKGRTRALRETLPSEDRLDELARTSHTVARVVLPAVVSIVTEIRTAAADLAADEIRNALRDVLPPMGEEGDAAERLDAQVDRLIEEAERTDRETTREGLGSGFVFDAEHGYILTNSHVVVGAKTIQVRLSDGRETFATVLGADPDTDLAVLRIHLRSLHELPFADSDRTQVGDNVLVMGNPFGLEGSVSRGIISAVNRRNLLVGGRRYDPFIQTDAMMSPGHSGGPMVNLGGEVIGINVAIATQSGSHEGVGFAIPSNRAVRMLPDLINGGPGFIGVIVGNVSDLMEETRILGWRRPYGAFVTEVIPGRAAEKAGIEVDDIIVEVDGHRIDSMKTLGRVLSATKPGSRVVARVWRDGRFMPISVQLGRRFAPE